MTNILARKRPHLRLPLLLAALTALIGALFAASAPLQAAPGDIDQRPVAYCHNTDTGVYVVKPSVNEGASFPITQVEDENGMLVNVTCPAEHAGRPVTVFPNGTAMPRVVAHYPELTLTADKPVVQPGETATFTMQINFFMQFVHNANGPLVRTSRLIDNAYVNAPSYLDENLQDSSLRLRLDYAYTSGELANPVLSGDPVGDLVDNQFPLTVHVPRGTTPGEYTVSVSVTWDEYIASTRRGADTLRTETASATFTVSEEPIVSPASVTLSLANAVNDNPRTSLDETRAETGSAPADGNGIWLKLEAFDALGEPAVASALQSITLQGVGATFAVHEVHDSYRAVGATDIPGWFSRLDPPIPGAAVANAAGSNSVTVQGANAVPELFVNVSKTDQQPGTVELSVFTNGATGFAQLEEPFTLTFTGPAAVLELGGDLSVGQPAAGGETMAETALMATDAVGNAVDAPSSVAYSITDADGNAVSGISATNSTVGASTTTTRDDDMNAAAVLVTIGDSVMPGSYTLTASLPGVDGSATSVVLKVAGPPANVELTADKTSGATLGDVITATAAVTDADGVPVADGSEVTFLTASPTLFLIGIDANATTPGFQSRTVDGEANGKFTVVGDGTALIIARIGGQSAIVVINSSTTPAAPPPPETAAECLSGASGLVSWICDDSASASEIFAELSEDGVTALHLYNGRDWVFYAIVNGRQVPGSVDFSVVKRDILFIGR